MRSPISAIATVEIETRSDSIGKLRTERAKTTAESPAARAGGPAVGLAMPCGPIRHGLAPKCVDVRPGLARAATPQGEARFLPDPGALGNLMSCAFLLTVNALAATRRDEPRFVP